MKINITRLQVSGAMAGIAALLMVTVMSYLFFFRGPPAIFYRAEMETPVVVPSGEAVATRGLGSVRMRFFVESPLEPECLVSTQYFIEFSDGSVAKVPGMKVQTRGQFKQGTYEAAIPYGAPLGKALFSIRDTYSCGFGARFASSPKVPFTISEDVDE